MGPGFILTRRKFCATAGAAVASVALGNSCSQLSGTGRLTARPRENVKTSATGRVMLGLDQERDAILQLPREAGKSPLPLFVMLHGATQSADDMFGYLGSTYEDAGVAVLAPNSRDTTWDVISGSGFGGGFGVDVALLDRALERVFETTLIDPARISIGGFSDGATYAVSLGLINGDLFRSVVAFSPGYVIAESESHGKPRFFISHGTNDHILPIDKCGRSIAILLKRHGYDVTFREFDGDHEIPDEIAREGLLWVTGS